ncbi:acid phosphatase [Trichoderma arundinaceum]|uniref:Acid phosphatase n=1 Tax=Trichoderma arundinaceum TaxID=490622 RepID=A0A395P0K2_TRIAR|nr:acid phosphatase [Trichoderma arundinaceum]
MPRLLTSLSLNWSPSPRAPWALLRAPLPRASGPIAAFGQWPVSKSGRCGQALLVDFFLLPLNLEREREREPERLPHINGGRLRPHPSSTQRFQYLLLLAHQHDSADKARLQTPPKASPFRSYRYCCPVPGTPSSSSHPILSSRAAACLAPTNPPNEGRHRRCSAKLDPPSPLPSPLLLCALKPSRRLPERLASSSSSRPRRPSTTRCRGGAGLDDAMAAFNSMPAMPAAPAAPSDAMGLNHGPPQPMGIDSFDPELNFHESLLALAPLPFTPSYEFDNFVTTFEDPFSYSSRPFEPITNQDVAHDEASPQELDNKLLGFSDPIMHATMVDEAGTFADLNMTAELYGMFFVAEDVFGGDNSGRPLELTCYRRNLWQCSGQITLPRVVTNVIDEQGRHIAITELYASITGLESIEGKAAEIISIPWKGANPQLEEAKIAAAPPNLTLDLSIGREIDANRVSLPVSWKRLQFKHATANNGRRKGLQQHYVVQINLLGKTKTGEIIKIAEIQSGPVIVRGRSPRNFDSRKDVHLTSDKKLERRNTNSTDNPTPKMERDNLLASLPRYPSSNGNEWATPQAAPQPSQSPHPAKRMALSPTVSLPPVPAWTVDGSTGKVPPPGHRNSFSRPPNPAAPITLSLSEDEKSPNRSSAELQSPQLSKSHPANGQNASNSPAEEADPLYEYFPLSVDDWMPPVDAIYRPHIVHHTIVAPEFKAQQISRKVKRYFTAD